MALDTVLIPLTTFLLSLLIAIIGWIGSRIHSRLEELNGTLINIERDIRHDLSQQAGRLAVVETEIKNMRPMRNNHG